MVQEVKKFPKKKKDYGLALNMNSKEKTNFVLQ